MSKIKVAVFGLNQGARIARLFKENDEVELTAVAGFGQQAIDVASEVGAKLYEDYNDLLANETLDYCPSKQPPSFRNKSLLRG